MFIGADATLTPSAITATAWVTLPAIAAPDVALDPAQWTAGEGTLAPTLLATGATTATTVVVHQIVAVAARAVVTATTAAMTVGGVPAVAIATTGARIDATNGATVVAVTTTEDAQSAVGLAAPPSTVTGAEAPRVVAQ